MASHRKQGTPADWKKNTLAGFTATRNAYLTQLEAIQTQINDLDVIIAGVDKMKLESEETPVEEVDQSVGVVRKTKPDVSAKSKHWTKNPPSGYKERRVWQAKIVKWQRKMTRMRKLAIKAKRAKRAEKGNS